MARGLILRERILELRKGQKSYNEIAKTLGISKGTVYYWASSDKDSQKTKRLLTERNLEKSTRRMRSLAKAMKDKWSKWADEAKNEAVQEYATLATTPLFVAGISIYWGEGDSNPKNPLRISNTDPRMVKVYSHFLRHILKIPKSKIKLGLILYPDLADSECKKFWAEIVGLEESNFVKTQYIKGHHPTKRLSRGICMIAVNTRWHKLKMLKWIDIFSKEITMDKLAGVV